MPFLQLVIIQTAIKPLVQTKRGVFKDSPDFDGELSTLVRAFALPLALLRKERHVFASARRADNAIRPSASNKIVNAVLQDSRSK